MRGTRITHYQRGGIPIETFAVFLKPDGAVQLPEFAEHQTIEQFIDILWERLVFFVEDFLALFLALRLRPGTVFARKNLNPLTPNPVVDRDANASGGIRWRSACYGVRLTCLPPNRRPK